MIDREVDIVDITYNWAKTHKELRALCIVPQMGQPERHYKCLDLFHASVGGVASVDKYQIFSIDSTGCISRHSFERGEPRLADPRFFSWFVTRIKESLTIRQDLQRHSKPIETPSSQWDKQSQAWKPTKFAISNTRPSIWYPTRWPNGDFYVGV